MSDSIRNILIAVIAAVIIVGVAWYFVYEREGATTSAPTTAPTTTPMQPPAAK